MIFQRPINYKVRAWGLSRHKNTFIYLLDNRDERDGGDYFHMVSLNSEEYISSKQANEKKIKDWTGLCENQKSVDELTFAIDRNNYFYVGTCSEIFVISLNLIENIPDTPQDDERDEMQVHSKHIYHANGEGMLKDHQMFPGVTLHKLYDTIESYEEGKVIGIFESKEN